MIASNTDSIPDREVSELLGVVTGNVVKAKHIGRDMFAGLKSIVGGEIHGYSELMSEARAEAYARMEEHARRRGADAILNVRFTTSMIQQGMSEVLAYGTAVRLRAPQD